MEEEDAVAEQQGFVVAILLAQVDDRADAVITRKGRNDGGLEAAADGELVRDPVEVHLGQATARWNERPGA